MGSIIFECQLDGGYDREKDEAPLPESPDEAQQAQGKVPHVPSPLGSSPPFCKMPIRNILVPGARSGLCLGQLTKAGEQHIWFPLVPLPGFPLCLIGNKLLEVS